MFQQLQGTQITLSSSTTILTQSGNSTAWFTFRTPNSWIIDTDTSDRITRNKSIMHNLSSPSSLSTLTLANGITSHVKSISTAKIIVLLPLSSVFYISKFLFNLLSINKLTRFLNCSVIFFPNHCVFEEIGMQKTIGTGCKYGSMYHLETGCMC